MGNIFARQRESLGSTLPMTAMGSHLDTQPQDGRYDGILGVVAGIEALRTMKENGYHCNFDIGVINWTNEEGARFPGTTVSSKVWAGEIPIQSAWDLRDVSNSSITVTGWTRLVDPGQRPDILPRLTARALLRLRSTSGEAPLINLFSLA
ncbi:hypothetical protein BDP81DRAFT_120694, partial [Colletotrichum phormii]